MARKAGSYTKGEVNRAGQLWVEFIAEGRARGDQPFEPRVVSLRDLLGADEVLRWWRAEHATPLRIVNANLRHYVRDFRSHGSLSV